MTNIVKFAVPYKTIVNNREIFHPGTLTTGTGISPIEEGIGPEYSEKYAYFSVGKNTIPHIDRFNTITDTYDTLPEDFYDNGNIILRGSTAEYIIKKYNNDDLFSLKQYFLKNPTRSELQYLIWDLGTDTADRFTAFIPGLLYDSTTGNALGYIHSYIADENGTITIELPYTDSSYNIALSGSAIVNIEDNICTVSNIYDVSVELTLTHGDDSISFNVFPNSLTGEEETYIVKNVNEFGDYSVASRKALNISDILNILSEMEHRTITIPEDTEHHRPVLMVDRYFPKTYSSLILNSPSEGVYNMTPNIYEVPAALVPNNSTRVFMVNVIGISANKINYGALNES